MSRRNKVFLLLVFPLAILIWSIGWLLYWTGSLRKSEKPKRMPTASDLKFSVFAPEETPEAEDTYSQPLEA
jgi:hypothetical protein